MYCKTKGNYTYNITLLYYQTECYLQQESAFSDSLNLVTPDYIFCRSHRNFTKVPQNPS